MTQQPPAEVPDQEGTLTDRIMGMDDDNADADDTGQADVQPYPEPPGGSDPTPPDLVLAAAVLVDLLDDVAEALRGRRSDQADLLLRIDANQHLLARIRESDDGGE